MIKLFLVHQMEILLESEHLIQLHCYLVTLIQVYMYLLQYQNYHHLQYPQSLFHRYELRAYMHQSVHLQRVPQAERVSSA